MLNTENTPNDTTEKLENQNQITKEDPKIINDEENKKEESPKLDIENSNDTETKNENENHNEKENININNSSKKRKKNNKGYSNTTPINKYKNKKIEIIKEENEENDENEDKNEKKEESTIKTEKRKIKRKIVVRKAIPKNEIKEEKEEINIKENKENEIDFDGISEEGSFAE